MTLSNITLGSMSSRKTSAPAALMAATMSAATTSGSYPASIVNSNVPMDSLDAGRRWIEVVLSTELGMTTRSSRRFSTTVWRIVTSTTVPVTPETVT